jgi:protein SCO1/2
MSTRNSLIMLLITLLGACGEAKLPSPFQALDITSSYSTADFQLTDFNGTPRRLDNFANKVVILFFGYTHCPEVCPTTLADLAQVMRQLGNDAGRVQVLFITLDPEQDNQEMLAQYLPYFDKTFLGLRGNAETTAQAAKAFGVVFQKHSNQGGGYTVDHSSGTYLIGLKGHPILLAPYGQRSEILVQDIKLLLALGR